MSTTPFVSVIVPVWNGAGEIERCVAALNAQSYPRERYEILVVDNGSSDDTPSILGRLPNIKVLSEPEPGSYCARNLGLRHASGDVVAFTDADCVPDPTWIETGIARLIGRPDAALIGGRIELFSEASESETCRLYELTFSFDQETTIRKGRCATANWMSPLGVLRKMGGFNAQLKSGADFELSRRLFDTGLTLLYEREMVVRHPFRGGWRELLDKRRRTTGGNWELLEGTRAKLRYVAGIPFGWAQRIAMIARNTSIPLHRKPGVATLVSALSIVQIAEIVRLALGGNPRRR